MTEVVLADGFADRRREIHVADSEITGARIVNASLETRRRQLDERMMLANCNRLRHRRNLPHQTTRFLTSESKRGFDFRVLRKVFCVGEIESAPRRIQTEHSLLTTLQRAGN